MMNRKRIIHVQFFIFSHERQSTHKKLSKEKKEK